MVPPKKKWYDLISRFADIFLPRVCLHCDVKLKPEEQYFCTECVEKMPLLSEINLNFFYNHAFYGTNVAELYTLYLFETDSPVQSVIHKLKYGKVITLGDYLGKKLAEVIPPHLTANDVIIIPIPLSKKRRNKRGYNQAELIAEPLAKQLGINYQSKLLKRVKNNPSQTFLNKEERKKNVEGIFEVSEKKNIQGKTILLIDDVLTTGATLAEAAKCLTESGAASVSCATIAVAKL